MTQGIYKLLIIEPNVIIGLGLEAVIKRSNKFRSQVITDCDMDNILSTARFMEPDLIIMSPLIMGTHIDERLRNATHSKILVISYGMMDLSSFFYYDGVVLLADSPDNIINNLQAVMIGSTEAANEEDDERLLSPREKDVVAYVAKGLTNKEISDKLSISIHTVITHRRNIAKKLKIHSPSGLTIYAIVNKLVNIDEIQM